MRRIGWRFRVAGALMIMLLTGCGAPVAGEPQPSTTPLPADQLVFLVEASGGFVPVLNAALQSPALAVYGDGRVIQYDEKKKERDVPAAYTVAKVDPALVATFAAETEALNLIQEGTDFGKPPVSDMPTTTVQLNGATGPHSRERLRLRRHVRQRRLRGAAQGAAGTGCESIDRAHALPGDAEQAPYRPDAVRVVELEDAEFTEMAPAWPGPAAGLVPVRLPDLPVVRHAQWSGRGEGVRRRPAQSGGGLVGGGYPADAGGDRAAARHRRLPFLTFGGPLHSSVVPRVAIPHPTPPGPDGSKGK